MKMAMHLDKSQVPSFIQYSVASTFKRDIAIMAGYRTALIKCVGASGGPTGTWGFNAGDVSNPSWSYIGGPGGGGGGLQVKTVALTAMSAFPAVVVGAAGAKSADQITQDGSTDPANGGNGGASTFDGALVMASGGEGGSFTGAYGGAGGAGGRTAVGGGGARRTYPIGVPLPNPNNGSYDAGTGIGGGGSGGNGYNMGGQVAYNPARVGGTGQAAPYLSAGGPINGRTGGSGGGATVDGLVRGRFNHASADEGKGYVSIQLT